MSNIFTVGFQNIRNLFAVNDFGLYLGGMSYLHGVSLIYFILLLLLSTHLDKAWTEYLLCR